MSLEEAVVGILIAILSGIGSVAVYLWQQQRKQPKVSLAIEVGHKGPWIISVDPTGGWSDPFGSYRVLVPEGQSVDDFAKPAEHLVLTTRIPNDGHPVTLERFEIQIKGKDTPLKVDHGSTKSPPCRLEPGTKCEWYATTDNVRQALDQAGAKPTAKLYGVVRDAAGNEYRSNKLSLKPANRPWWRFWER